MSSRGGETNPQKVNSIGLCTIEEGKAFFPMSSRGGETNKQRFFMQYFKTLILIIAVSFFSFCGDEETTQTESENTGNQFVPLATLSVVNSSPLNGNGLIDVTEIISVPNAAGGDQVVRITGTVGEEPDLIKHQIEIHYTNYYVDLETKGKITMITHSWGTELINSVDGGISVCNENCEETTIFPKLHTLIFNNQPLTASTNDSTLQGTVVYP
jgi:hypothetical protein